MEPLDDDTTEKQTYDTSLALWGIGSRLGMILLFGVMGANKKYEIRKEMEPSIITPRTIQIPSAMKQKDKVAQKKSPHVHFSENDLSRPSLDPRPDGGDNTAVQGLGITGEDVMRLFTSIVEQEDCPGTAAGVLRSIERTEVDKRIL